LKFQFILSQTKANQTDLNQIYITAFYLKYPGEDDNHK